MRILNIGCVPPPFGGVSIHIKRLHEYLLREGLDSWVIDISGTPKEMPRLLAQTPRELVRLWGGPRTVLHFHYDGFKFLGLMAALTMRHVVVYSLHNERFMHQIDALHGLKRGAAIAALQRLHAVITDNLANLAFVREQLGLKNALMIPEYIPSGPASDRDLSRLAPWRERFNVLLSSNAFQIAFHQDEDLYGLDLLVDMVGRLDPAHRAGMVFILPGRGREDYLETLQARLQQQGDTERFVFVREPLDEATSLWRMSDVVIRATNTDGNSLTIHEALSAGTPVVASDCVPRPEGVILFRNRDAEDLTRAVESVLINLPRERERVGALAVPNNAEALKALYLSLMENHVES